ncbi:MAG: TetR/AcrR family transcriptional regulator [Pseudomonadota bacterium]|nr:TetR/AcrR family transcriptional regulator [Pseudomonadota bacterium]
MSQQNSKIANRPKRAPKLSPEKRREQLIDCAIEIYVNLGIEGARRSHVALRAGVSVPTVYAYFDTRESLTEAVLNRVESRITEIVWNAAAEDELAFDKILNVARAFSNTVELDSAIMKIWLDWSTAFENATWTLYEDLQGRVANLFCEIIGGGQTSGELSPDLDPEIAAYIIIGGGQMAAQMKLTSPAAIDIEVFLHQLVAGALQTKEISKGGILV